MKKRVWRRLVMSIVGLTFLSWMFMVPGTQAQAPKAIKLRVVDIYTKGHPLNDGITWFFSEVEKRTNGRVTFEHYPNQQLVKGPDILDAVGNRIVEMGVLIYAGAKVPLLFVPQLPFAYGDEDVKKVTDVWYNIVTDKNKHLWKTLDKFNQRPIIAYVTTNYQIGTTKKPVKTLSDLKGLKIRVSGAVLPETISKLDAVGVSMTTGDAYEALQRGGVDGASHPVPSYAGLAYFELIKYATVNFNLGGTCVAYSINKNVWESLPGDVQEIITKAGLEASEYTAQHYLDSGKAALQGIWKEKRIVVDLLSKEDQARVKQLVEPVQEKWISNMASKGLPARELVADWERQLKSALK